MSRTFFESALFDTSPDIWATPKEYVPGTLNVFINGSVRVASNVDGFIELGNRKFQLKQIATPGTDDVQVVYESPDFAISDASRTINVPVRVRHGGGQFKASVRWSA